MARVLSQTLIRGPKSLIRGPSSPSLLLSGVRRCPPCILPPSSRLLSCRGSSGSPDRPPAGELIEVDLEAGDSGDDSGEGEGEVVLRRLEEAIHGLIIRRAAPSWLPFVPGASYWVPPRKKAYGMIDLVGKLTNPLTEEEELSLTTIRGWPSSAYYVEGISPHTVKKSPKKAAAQSDDEE